MDRESSVTQVPAGKAMLMEVIYVETARGSGHPDNPVRTVLQYWSKDGRLLAEYDTIFPEPDMHHLVVKGGAA